MVFRVCNTKPRKIPQEIRNHENILYLLTVTFVLLDAGGACLFVIAREHGQQLNMSPLNGFCIPSVFVLLKVLTVTLYCFDFQMLDRYKLALGYRNGSDAILHSLFYFLFCIQSYTIENRQNSSFFFFFFSLSLSKVCHM